MSARESGENVQRARIRKAPEKDIRLGFQPRNLTLELSPDPQEVEQ
jgi:hypothetical protein